VRPGQKHCWQGGYVIGQKTVMIPDVALQECPVTAIPQWAVEIVRVFHEDAVVSKAFGSSPRVGPSDEWDAKYYEIMLFLEQERIRTEALIDQALMPRPGVP